MAVTTSTPGAVQRGDYDVVWSTPSTDSGGSMPCGGHDVGVNVWVEDGSIRCYVDRSGSFDEHNLMLKLGRVVLELEPNPFGPDGLGFEQRLDLHRGRVRISGSSAAAGRVEVTIWCETGAPAVHLDVTAERPLRARVGYESWRTEHRIVPDEQRVATYSSRGRPDDIVTFADTVRHDADDVVFFHRNRNDESCVPRTIALEGFGHRLDEFWDPLKDLVFGGVLRGGGFKVDGESTGTYADVPYRAFGLVAGPRTEHAIVLALHSDHVTDIDGYLEEARSLATSRLAERERARDEAQAFWAGFWARSAVEIRPARPDPDDPDWQVGRNYTLFRYLLGCNAHGSHPTKFNGGLFTTDARHSVPGEDYGTPTPDFRVWGGGSSTGQNQRLVHWPMLRNGDTDLLRPQFDYYRLALGNALIRTRELWGHGGCAFAEQLENFGLPIAYEWGWGSDRDGDDEYPRARFLDPTELGRPWVRYHYSTQLEICFMITKAHLFAGIPIDEYLPFIDASLTFFDEHYRMRHRATTGFELSQAGELVIFPSTALETYKDATNPTDVVEGLRSVLEMMLGPLRHLIDDPTAERYRSLLGTLPAQAYRVVEGRRVLAPAQSFSDIMNVELPQLYPVFPYERFGVGRPDLQVAVDTYRAPADIDGQRDHISWHQDGIFAARLGLADEARRIARLKLADGPLRFPAFWGPGHDWVPDHNWGGSGMIGVQESLLQEVDGALHVLPAWADDLDVTFRLHASGGTIVEVEYADGSVVRCDVTPSHRAADLVLHKPDGRG
jgi:hypothetical protein